MHSVDNEQTTFDPDFVFKYILNSKTFIKVALVFMDQFGPLEVENEDLHWK